MVCSATATALPPPLLATFTPSSPSACRSIMLVPALMVCTSRRFGHARASSTGNTDGMAITATVSRICSACSSMGSDESTQPISTPSGASLRNASQLLPVGRGQQHYLRAHRVLLSMYDFPSFPLSRESSGPHAPAQPHLQTEPGSRTWATCRVAELGYIL